MKTLKKPKAIIWDWDNTLAENRDVVVGAMNIVLTKYGKEEWEITKKKYRDPNKSLKENFVNFFGQEEKEAYEFYLQNYIKFNGLIKSAKNSLKLLKLINTTDVKSVIISNKEKSLLLMEIETLFKDIDFFKIMGNGDSEKNKPDASPIIKSLEDTGIEINPENVWLVGDSKLDVDCAYNSNIQPILVGKGNFAVAEFFEEKKKANPPLQQIMDFAEMIELFEKYI